MLSFVASSFAMAQVGINTGNDIPRDVLDVKGNILIDSYLILDNHNNAQNNYHLLVRSTDTTPVGEVKLLDVNLRNVGPVNKYTVKINNVADQSVLNLNTGLDVSKYYLGTAEAVFKNANVKNVSTSNSKPIYGTYYASVSKANGKYLISLNFNNAGTQNNANGDWEVSFIVFEKTLVKDWGTFTGSVTEGNNYSGASTNTPMGLQ